MKPSTAAAFILALLLHGAIIAILAVNVSLDKPRRPRDSGQSIMHAVMVSPPQKGVANPKPQEQTATDNQKLEELKAAEQKRLEAKRELERQVQAQREEEAKRALALKKKQEEEAKAKAQEEARKKAEEEARKQAEAQAKALAEEQRRKAEEEKRKAEEAKKKAQEEARKKAEEEARRKAQEQEEALLRSQQQQAQARADSLEEQLLGTADGTGSAASTGSGIAAEYGSRVQMLIEQNWRIEPSMNGKRVVVTLNVDPQGMISGERCQGDSEVCAGALATLRLIGMLPRPPAQCPDCNSIVITMTPKI